LWEENIEFVLKKIVITTSLAFQNLPCLEKKIVNHVTFQVCDTVYSAQLTIHVWQVGKL